jgi:hypothetical protein
MKPGIKQFDAFIKSSFSKQIREAFEELRILSEGDLQAHAWFLIQQFFQELGSTGKKFKVLNKPYFKDVRIHPDIAVFRRAKPWLLIELKERKRLTERSARKEWARLIKAKKLLHPKRGYLVYVARYGNGAVLRGPKGPGAKYFFEVPIILEDYWTPQRIEQWEKTFKVWSKFVASKQA